MSVRPACLVLLAFIWSCGSGPGGRGAVTPASGLDWYRPPPGVSWYWQLQGTVDPGYDGQLYDIDLFDVSSDQVSSLQASGKRVLCYFSAGSYEEWREDAGSFSAQDLGNPLDDWPGERWLDIRSERVRSAMLDRLERARDKGCDGVEPDNVEGYAQDTGFPLTAADQLAFNRFLADAAHQRGLAVALKNDLAQVPDLVDRFDMAVNEQCHEYGECNLLEPFVLAGKPVLNAEYADRYVDDASARSALCADAVDRGFSTLVLPLALDGSFLFRCGPGAAASRRPLSAPPPRVSEAHQH